MYSVPLNSELVTSTRMVLARNVQPSSKMEPVATLSFKDDGTYDGGMSGLWEIKDGQLMMSDVWKKLMFVFRGAEIRNGSAFLTGEPLMEAQVSGFVRSVLYPCKSLSDGFRICISSHVDYVDDAAPRLLRSLARLSFPKERVVVVVGGAKKPAASVTDGWKIEEIVQNFDGYTALSFLAARPLEGDDYWLLLHDTSEVADDFLTRVGGIDIGLNYDMIIRYAEIGLYSADFIRFLGQVKAFDTHPSFVTKDYLSGMSRLWCDLSGNTNNHAVTKDVYGTGTKRDVLYFGDFGIKKFRRASGMGAKP